MSGQGFTHLHLHTQFSLLDGAVSPKKLFARCKELGMDSVAMTDHGNMFGAVDFYRSALNAGIKPIIGIEAYFAPKSRHDKSGKIGDNSYHLVLLAENNTGYRNLLKLSSIAYTEGFYYRPRVDEELLRQYGDGIIATSACIGGEVPRLFIQGKEEAAREAAIKYIDIFGKDNFFLELQRHDYVDDVPKDPNPFLVDLAKELGIGVVATNDVHFLEKDDYDAHDALTCISTGKLVSDSQRMKYPTSVYLKSSQEMRELFSDIPEACDNTLEIAARCNVEIDLQTRHAPTFHPPEGKTDGEYLTELVYAGAKKLYGEITPEIDARIKREIEVIDGKGFSSYFLIVWDFCNWAAEHGIPTGARGSGVGTIVGYCLGMCNVDPIKYGLLFERFMDPERDEMPDIDIDICQDGRPRLLEHVREKYGEVAQITTFGTMKARGVIRDVCRVLNISLSDADKLAKLIPSDAKTLEKAIAVEKELADIIESDPQIKHAFEIASKLEGLTRHASVHACAVVIADEPLMNFLPIYKQSGSDDIITQFEGPEVEAVGLLKMDFLGLRTLSVIEQTKRWIKQLHGEELDINAINIEDAKVFEIFASGKTKGVFQFESGGMQDLLIKMKPDRLEDLIAANALYRPGPMALIPDFVARKHGADWDVEHPIMREFLEETFGIMIYQEQVMQICHALGGIKLRAAYTLIKAIGKKKHKVIEAAKEQFVKGCVEKGLSQKQGNYIFELIEKFAGYGFNKSHATRYSFVAYQTAFLKAYWPCEFMASLLTYENTTDKIVEYIGECKDMNIPVLPPDINESFTDFTVIYENEEKKKTREAQIRFGLGAVKGVGEKAVEQIILAREKHGKFLSLFDFCENVDLRTVNKQVIESLIKAGAFDRLGGSRAQLIAALENAMKMGQSAQADMLAGQGNLFDAFNDAQTQASEDTASLPDVPAWPEMTMLKFEKEVLGMYVTSNPLSRHADTITAYSTAHTNELASCGEGKSIVIGGMITKIRNITIQNGRNAGNKMVVFELEDFNGKTEVVVFTKLLAKIGHLLELDKVIFVKGTIDCKRETPNILCDSIIDISEADEKLTAKVKLRFEAEKITQQMVDDVRSLCQRYKGKSPVHLSILASNNRRIYAIADSEYSVCADIDFRSKMREIVGEENFELVR